MSPAEAAKATMYTEGARGAFSELYMPNPVDAAINGVILGGLRSPSGYTSGGLLGYTTAVAGNAGYSKANVLRHLSAGSVFNNVILRAAGGVMRGIGDKGGSLHAMGMRIQASAVHGMFSLSSAARIDEAAAIRALDAAGITTKPGASLDDIAKMIQSHGENQVKMNQKIAKYQRLKDSWRSKWSPFTKRFLRNAEAEGITKTTQFVESLFESDVAVRKGAKVAGTMAPGFFDDIGKVALGAHVSDGKIALNALKGARGTTLATGFLGKAISVGGIGLFGTQLVMEGVKMAASMAGEAYVGAAKATAVMHEAMGLGPTRLGAGFTNSIAVTERQRAASALRSSNLNPRGMLMGNEAALMSR